MTTYFVTRHPGAVEWANQQGIQVDNQVDHLELATVESGDTVIGSLPVNLAAEICQVGARYLHLSLKLPLELRGKELTAEQMMVLNTKLIEYQIKSIDPDE